MAIIISENGKNAKKLDSASFGLEDKLQQYIYDNPESVPVYDIREDIRLLILAREFPTNSGPIDALGVDQDGTIYIIETKLYKNPDKRLVIAQALDYGASMWRHATDFDDFSTSVESKVQQQFGVGLQAKLQDFFTLDDEAATILLQNVRTNLSTGKFKFVVLMDQLHDRLKDLILFINRNSQFDVYAVELDYYKHDKFEIIIPKLYGAEVKKDVTSSQGRKSGTTLSWTSAGEEDFVKAVSTELTADSVMRVKRSIELLHQAATTFGTEIMTKRAETAGGVRYKLQLLDENHKGAIGLSSDGWLGFYHFGKQGPLASHMEKVLRGVIDAGILGKDASYLDKTQWFVNLTDSSIPASELDQLERLMGDISPTPQT